MWPKVGFAPNQRWLPWLRSISPEGDTVLRRLLSFLAGAALLVGVLAAAPTSALAASTSGSRTSLALTRFYQMAAGDDRLFVSGGPSQNSVAVLTFDGSVDTTLENIPGASGLAIHDSILYVAAFGASRIERFDLTTHPPTKLSSLSTAPLTEPVDVVFAGGKLWFTSHCDQWGTSIASMELDGSNVTEADPGGSVDWSYCGGIIGSAFAPNRLFAQARGTAPTYLYEYNVRSGSMVLVHQDNWGHGPFGGSDIAVLPDGAHFVMGSLNNVGLGEFQMSDFFGPTFTYTADRWSGAAVATAPNGLIAGGIRAFYEKEVWVWDAGSTAARVVYDFPDGGANELWWQGLEFSPDGSRLFAATGAYDDQVVIHVLNPSQSTSRLTLDASDSELTYGESTKLTAHLAPIGGAQLKILATPAGGSQSLLAEGTADGNGDLSVQVQPRVNATYVAEFAGDASRSPATSDGVEVKVRALVRGRMRKFYGARDGYKLYRTAQDIYYAAEVLPHKIGKRLWIEYQYRSGGRWRSGGDAAFEIRRRDGLVVIAFQGGSLPPGRYRFQSWYGGDASNLPGLSEWSLFEVTGRTSRVAARSAPGLAGFPGTPVG